MKKFFWIPFLFFAALFITRSAFVFAENPQQLFAAANHLYLQKKYDSAAAKYQQLIKAGYQKTDLFYNAGNAYYKLNQWGQAIYNYEKAQRLSPDDPAIKHNLQLANQHVIDNVEGLPALFFQQWTFGFVHLFPINGWAISLLLFAWITLLFFLFFISKKIPRLSKWIMSISGALCILSAVAGITAFRESASHDEAIVMPASAKLKSAPDNNSADLQEIHEGLKVTVLDMADGWEKIKLANGKEGWVEANAVKVF